METNGNSMSWMYGPLQQSAFDAIATHKVVDASKHHMGYRGLFEGGLVDGEAIGGSKVRYRLTLRGRQIARLGGFAAFCGQK